jgi:hypothetical protein
MARSTKKGAFVDTHLMVKIETMNRANDKEGGSHVVAALDGSSGHDWSHHCGAQRQEICAGVCDRKHGGAQAGRVFRHASVQGSLDEGSVDGDGGEAEVEQLE